MKNLLHKAFDLPVPLRWLIWLTCVGTWTTALLTSEPVQIARATLPTEAIFPTAKTLHIGAYSLLTVLTGWLLVPFPYRFILLAFLSMHAMSTEFLQQFVPLRGGSWRDVGLDHIGIVVGLGLSWRWWSKRKTDGRLQ